MDMLSWYRYVMPVRLRPNAATGMRHMTMHSPHLREVEIGLAAGDAVLLAQRQHPRARDTPQLVPWAGSPHLAPACRSGGSAANGMPSQACAKYRHGRVHRKIGPNLIVAMITRAFL